MIRRIMFWKFALICVLCSAEEKIVIRVNPHVLMKQATTLRRKEDFKGAQEMGRLSIQAMVAAGGDHVDFSRMLILQAINETEMECFEDAIGLYKSVDTEELTDREKLIVHCNLGFCYQKLGRTEMARSQYRALVDTEPNPLGKTEYAQHLLSFALLEFADAKKKKSLQLVSHSKKMFGDNPPFRYWTTLFDINVESDLDSARIAIRAASKFKGELSKKERLRLFEREARLAARDGDPAAAAEHRKAAVLLARAMYGESHRRVASLLDEQEKNSD